MTDDQIRIAFSTPPSEEVQKIADERSKFETWLTTVIGVHTSWDGRCPLSIWQFSKDELNNSDLAWKAWLAAKGMTS